MAEEALYKRLVLSLVLFIGIFVLGAMGYFVIGLLFGKPPDPAAAPDVYAFTLLNCFYMAAITVSTVGYGEVANPHTALTASGEKIGVIYTTVYVLIAYLVVLYASANIVAALVEGAVGKIWLRRKMEKALKAMQGHYVVCGVGSTGRHIVEELLKTGHSVIAIDRTHKAIEDLPRHERLIWIDGDASEDETLAQAGLDRAAGLFAALPHDKDNLVITLSARQVNAKLRIVARAVEFNTLAKLRRVGADVTISPNHIGGMRMASEMLRPHVTGFLDTMLRQADASMRFNEVPIEEGDSAANRALRDIDTVHHLGVGIICIVHPDRSISYNPIGDTVVKPGDAVVVVCNSETLAKIRQHIRTGVK